MAAGYIPKISEAPAPERPRELPELLDRLVCERTELEDALGVLITRLEPLCTSRPAASPTTLSADANTQIGNRIMVEIRRMQDMAQCVRDTLSRLEV
jgi:hypothetical protein